MDTLNVTIILILIALASTTVTVFWNGGQRARLLIFSLAFLSSCGAIYEAYQTEAELRAISNRLDQLIISSSPLPGFEENLAKAADYIAKQEGYAKSKIHDSGDDWESEDFGYLISFFEPISTRPETGYEEIAALIGLEHGFAYVSKASLHKLTIAFARGVDIRSLPDCCKKDGIL